MAQSGKLVFLRNMLAICGIGLLVAVAFLAANLGIRGEWLEEAADARDSRELSGHLARAALRLRQEEREAARFVVLSAADVANLTTREQQARFSASVSLSDNAMLRVYEFARSSFDADSDTLAKNPFYALRPGALGGFRSAVLRRNIAADDVRSFYDELVLATHRLLAHSAQRSSKRSAAMTASTIFSTAGVGRASSLFWRLHEAATRSAPLGDVGARAVESWRRELRHIVDALGVALRESSLRAPFEALVAPAADAVTQWSRNAIRFSAPTVPFTFSLSAAASTTVTTPGAAFEALADSFDALISDTALRITDAPPLSGEELASGAAVAIAAIVCALVAVLVTAQRYIRATISSKQDQTEEQMLTALEQSYDRMQDFVNGIGALRADLTKEADLDAKQTQTLEREVYRLREPARQLLSFAHPALATCAAASFTPGADDGSGSADGALAGELVPCKLRTAHVTLVLLDLSAFNTRPSSESVKTVPSQLQNAVKTIDEAVRAADGIVHEVSGSTVICGWNLTKPCHDTEAIACQTAIALASSLESSRNVPVTFAAVSGEVEVGYVGSQTMKCFVVLGPVMPLGKLLLRLNRIHGTAMVIDNTTFSKLDAQVYKTRPLEVVAVDARSPSTVAFELLLWTRTHERDGRFVSWNEAFEEYKSGDPLRARHLFATWVTTYGANRSAERMLAVLSESPPRTTTLKFSDDGCNFEDDLM